LDRADRRDGGEGLFEVFDGVCSARLLDPGDHEGAFCGGWGGFGHLYLN
jgi:hypothetical protein